MFGLSMTEVVIILGLALLLLGPGPRCAWSRRKAASRERRPERTPWTLPPCRRRPRASRTRSEHCRAAEASGRRPRGRRPSHAARASARAAQAAEVGDPLPRDRV